MTLHHFSELCPDEIGGNGKVSPQLLYHRVGGDIVSARRGALRVNISKRIAKMKKSLATGESCKVTGREGFYIPVPVVDVDRQLARTILFIVAARRQPLTPGNDQRRKRVVKPRS